MPPDPTNFLSWKQRGEPTIPHISEGRIGQSKFCVNVDIWIDARTRLVQGYVFSESNPEHVTPVCELLGLIASKIKPKLA